MTSIAPSLRQGSIGGREKQHETPSANIVCHYVRQLALMFKRMFKQWRKRELRQPLLFTSEREDQHERRNANSDCHHIRQFDQIFKRMLEQCRQNRESERRQPPFFIIDESHNAKGDCHHIRQSAKMFKRARQFAR